MANTKITSRVLADDAVNISNINTVDGNGGASSPSADGQALVAKLTVGTTDYYLDWATISGGASAIDGLSDGTTQGTRNTGLGANALDDGSLSATQCTAVGESAATAVTSGTNTNAFGYGACGSVTTGANNCAFGTEALALTSTGHSNNAFGKESLLSNTTGVENIAIGTNALRLNTTASNNVAVGVECLDGNTTGTQNTAIGKAALGANTTGNYNTAVGAYAIDAATHSNNTAVGWGAGTSITTSDNTAVGKGALYDQSSGDSNTAMGHEAIENLTTGIHTVGIGRRCASNTTTGGYNVFVGANNQTYSASASSQVVLGYGVTSQGGGYCTIGNSGSSWTRVDIGSTTWYSSSDKRLKKNINSLNAGLDFINDIRPVTYEWKTKGEVDSTLSHYEEGSQQLVRGGDSASGLQYGFIAQEIKEAIDNHNVENNGDVWHENEEGIQDVGATGLIPMLVKAVQELSEEIRILKENNNG